MSECGRNLNVPNVLVNVSNIPNILSLPLWVPLSLLLLLTCANIATWRLLAEKHEVEELFR